jgi:predicted secreted protein
MTVGSPTHAHGAVIKIGDGASPEVFTNVSKLLADPQISGRSVEMVSFKTHDVAYIQKLPGLIENGQIQFQVAYDSDDTTHAALESAFEAKTAKNFKIVMTDTGARQFAFSAFVQNLSYSMPNDNLNTMSVTLEVRHTWTPT